MCVCFSEVFQLLLISFLAYQLEKRLPFST